jgi:thiol:disulfide interchange protein DsbC
MSHLDCKDKSSLCDAIKKYLGIQMGIFPLAIIGALALTAPAYANEATIRAMLASKIDGTIESVFKSRIFELYEVTVRTREGVEILYVNEKATLIFVGNIIDASTGQNLTQDRIRKLESIDFSTLPLQLVVTTIRGNGRRKIAIFSDPNCPYCKRFENDLARLNDLTVHIFMYPVIKPESVALTKSVWCSKDRTKAWNDLMLKEIRPAAPPDCDTPINKILELGKKLGATSTPTWFLENGERYKGAVPLQRIEQLLDTASPKR